MAQKIIIIDDDMLTRVSTADLIKSWGYEVEVPMSTFYNLPVSGEHVTLLTHLVVREDAHLLYGFLTAAERSAFRQLIRISGVGARKLESYGAERRPASILPWSTVNAISPLSRITG